VKVLLPPFENLDFVDGKRRESEEGEGGGAEMLVERPDCARANERLSTESEWREEKDERRV
jgi:hypothetical protein